MGKLPNGHQHLGGLGVLCDVDGFGLTETHRPQVGGNTGQISSLSACAGCRRGTFILLKLL